MFIINIRGGLGNQMFQYAFSVVMRERYGEQIRFSRFYINRENADRKLSLTNLNIDDVKCLNSSVEKIVSYYYKLKLKFYQNKLPDQNGLFGEKNFSYLSNKGLLVSQDVYQYFQVEVPTNKIKYVDAYFQSAKYFEEYKEMIIEECRVSPKIKIGDSNKKMLNFIESVEAVCVHIRRGDYTSNEWSNALLICDEEYYKKGIKHVKKQVPNAKFFIFSNTHEDIEWIKYNYSFSEDTDITYVDLGNCDYEDLMLMYHCKHFVLSNSSYSWWAQYLSYNNIGKIVVAPSKWTRMNLDFHDIYMDGWEIVEVD